MDIVETKQYVLETFGQFGLKVSQEELDAVVDYCSENNYKLNTFPFEVWDRTYAEAIQEGPEDEKFSGANLADDVVGILMEKFGEDYKPSFIKECE